MHIPVLLDEVCEFFKGASGILIDATLGLGGHTHALLEQNENLVVIGIDKDREALALASDNLRRFDGRFFPICGSFGDEIKDIIKKHENIYGILADIGISSYQIDNPARGFSFESENLDMRMDLDSEFSAKELINSYTKDELSAIFRDYGEIERHEQMAKLIIDYRHRRVISSARELSELVASKNVRKSQIHPATLVFQAIRIAVNDELGELKRLLENISHLRGTKVAIISFHSLEDRIVKEKFKELARNCICDENLMKCECGGNNARGSIVTKKPITPSQDEILRNHRSRSAKMRCFEFFKDK